MILTDMIEWLSGNTSAQDSLSNALWLLLFYVARAEAMDPGN